ncbi:MAG: endonuclease III domain-containing protein [Promethearchaeota archaeon]
MSFDIDLALSVLTEELKKFNLPMVDALVEQKKADPFRVVVSTLLSARTKDSTTGPASERLFTLAQTPERMSQLSLEQIEEAIYPVGFWRNKAKHILALCKILIEEYDSQVPNTVDQLVKLPGVGRKTANLVVTRGFGLPGICVDTHVFRITKRWGYTTGSNPEKVEFELRRKLPKKWWIPINGLLVTHGQNICTPISPKCSQCPINNICPKIGVEKHR